MVAPNRVAVNQTRHAGWIKLGLAAVLALSGFLFLSRLGPHADSKLTGHSFLRRFDTDRAEGPPDSPALLLILARIGCAECFDAQVLVSRMRDKYPEHLAVQWRLVSPSNSGGFERVLNASRCAARYGNFSHFHREILKNSESLESMAVLSRSISQRHESDSLNECIAGQEYSDDLTDDDSLAAAISLGQRPLIFLNGIRIEPRMSESRLNSFVAAAIRGRMPVK